MHFNHILIDPFFSSFILFVFAFIHPEKNLISISLPWPHLFPRSENSILTTYISSDDISVFGSNLSNIFISHKNVQAQSTYLLYLLNRVTAI